MSKGHHGTLAWNACREPKVPFLKLLCFKKRSWAGGWVLLLAGLLRQATSAVHQQTYFATQHDQSMSMGHHGTLAWNACREPKVPF